MSLAGQSSLLVDSPAVCVPSFVHICDSLFFLKYLAHSPHIFPLCCLCVSVHIPLTVPVTSLSLPLPRCLAVSVADGGRLGGSQDPLRPSTPPSPVPRPLPQLVPTTTEPRLGGRVFAAKVAVTRVDVFV